MSKYMLMSTLLALSSIVSIGFADETFDRDEFGWVESLGENPVVIDVDFETTFESITPNPSRIRALPVDTPFPQPFGTYEVSEDPTVPDNINLPKLILFNFSSPFYNLVTPSDVGLKFELDSDLGQPSGFSFVFRTFDGDGTLDVKILDVDGNVIDVVTTGPTTVLDGGAIRATFFGWTNCTDAQVGGIEFEAGKSVTYNNFSFAYPGEPDEEEITPLQELLSFENPFSWNVIEGGNATLLPQFEEVTEFATSLEVDGGGYNKIESDPFSSSDLPPGATSVSIDVYVGSDQPNPYWVGDVSFMVHAPSAGLYNRWVGWAPLTGLPQDEFSTITYDLPADVQAALAGDHDDVQLRWATNFNFGAGPYYLDNIQFNQ